MPGIISKIGIILITLVIGAQMSCEGKRMEIVEIWDNNAPKEAFQLLPSGEKAAWVSWYRNGIKAEEKSFSGGVPHGTYRKWSITGFVMETGKYKDSLREGKWNFFLKGKVPYMQGSYKKGLKHGKWTVFNEKGKVAAEQFYSKDSAVGIWRKFQNNILIEENSCHIANETGHFKLYTSEGKASIYQECRHGKPSGVFMSYYPGGSLQKVGQFEAGLRNGLWVEYFASGNLRKIERWISDMRNGEWLRFSEEGEVLFKAEFIDGTGLFEDTSWQNNRIHGEVRISLRGGEFLRVESWENGVKLSTRDYHKDFPKPVAQGFWENGKKEGAWRTWYRSGVLRDSLNFREGELFGTQFYYDSTGRLYKKETVVGRNIPPIVEMF
ncbi:MAG: hypothetical protein LBC85_06065 [Fibromonadaceae bacterium]|jgi:antitoxin component YwqK of YwqJK toxin-antitoxin module|nr:hypothetical protein [Fibromonadaceae bacterium]